MSNFYTSTHVRGSRIYLRGYDSGRRVQEIIDYKPYLYIKSKKPSEYKTIEGESVSRIDFPSMYDAKQFIEKYSNVSGFEYFDYTFFLYQYIYDEYPGEIKYDPSLVSVCTIDIEVASDQGFPDIQIADKPITAITYRKNKKSVVFGCNYYKPKSDDVTYVMCKDENDLLEKFILLWNHKDWVPDIITGWNVEFFDIPYIVNRINRVLGQNEAKRLSPWKILEERTIEIRGTPNQTFVPLGVVVLDYLHLYKKFSFSNHESYRLDHIANVELGEKKLDYSEYESLLELYKKDFEKFIDYNIHDVVLVDKLEEKLGFIQQVMALAYDAKVNYVDTLTTVRPWDVIIRNYLMDKKIVIPQFEPYKEAFEFVGGYVKSPQIGMHKWVVSFDLNSLYPHLIMQYNISPETFVGKTQFPSIDYLLQGIWEYRDGSVAYAANGCMYKKDKQGFLPEIMQRMYDDRVLYKKKMIEAKIELEAIDKEIARRENLKERK
jgi:DNA polymerase elongation subunit (family B)